ncbi:unnamed protein product [Didymodactylos carnosus]|nr:unnamed protein product [Didymodactylos carnosus]CAF3798759.1 unnamed protein product [Didymodactylos carnosus]
MMMNQSSTRLNDIYIKLNNTIEPMIILLGTIGNLISIYVFSRPAVRSSCSTYFFALSVNNFPVLYFGVLTRMLADGFSIDPTRYSAFFCKFRNYFSYVVYQLTPWLTLLATIDRWCASSTNPNVRKFSTIYVSYRVIFAATLILALSNLHMFIFFEIHVKYSICIPKAGIYTKFFSTSAWIMGLLCLSLTILFGLLTMSNIRQQRCRYRQLDRQLSFMVLFYALLYIILGIPFSFLTFLSTMLTRKGHVFHFITNLSRITLNMSYCLTFNMYGLGARLYRYEFFNVINKISYYTLGINVITFQVPHTQSRFIQVRRMENRKSTELALLPISTTARK